jgi:hypothetical protein
VMPQAQPFVVTGAHVHRLGSPAYQLTQLRTQRIVPYLMQRALDVNHLAGFVVSTKWRSPLLALGHEWRGNAWPDWYMQRTLHVGHSGVPCVRALTVSHSEHAICQCGVCHWSSTHFWGSLSCFSRVCIMCSHGWCCM